jgi:hypothetical protein
MGYADDHSIYDSFLANNRTDEHNIMSKLTDCMKTIRNWMSMNRLKMNDTKTEFILFGNQLHVKKCDTTEIIIGNDQIQVRDEIKYLGVVLDSKLNMLSHIRNVCKVTSFNLYNIRKIRPHLTISSTKQLIQSLVITHLDYANSLYYGLPASTLHRLQRIQNIAAKIILKLKRTDSTTNALLTLHWLPVPYRIEYKIILTVFKALHKMSPQYIIDLIQIKDLKTYNLRSSKSTVLEIPRISAKSFGGRSFNYSGPKLWNDLPVSIRNITNIDMFKKALKTYLFKKAFKLL